MILKYVRGPCIWRPEHGEISGARLFAFLFSYTGGLSLVVKDNLPVDLMYIVHININIHLNLVLVLLVSEYVYGCYVNE